MSACGENCRGTKRRSYCTDRSCGGTDCSCCYGPGVDHSYCDACPTGCDNGRLPCVCDGTGWESADVPCTACGGVGMRPCPDCSEVEP